MSAKPDDIEAIYNAALAKTSEAERAAYLDAACGGDEALRRRVEELLKAHERAADFLEVPALDAGVTLDSSPITEGPGTLIGRYELLELIGEGGMGLVYLAEQKKPVRRRVALKIIKPGMDSKQVIGRFEAERQALALLDHPNIAHVFDAGTTETGRPYFVMEYVKGMSITRYCDEHKLNIERRLRLFEQVCEAVHHAHQKGIIHRDIKPSNILVSIQGDKAVPKIIDFGIAKAITQPLTDKTFVTSQGQLLGTPEYMSPEQVDLVSQDVDTRSDIYSLGVGLYELLAGVLPFEKEFFERAGFAEIQQTIRELEPASPSIRLTSLGEKAKMIAVSRGTQVIALARRLHRELEWIPLKAMRKNRCRRYRSASEMADDIRNYLNGLPLIAGPETAMYRVKKFMRKHAGSVATAALVAAVIVLGLVVSTAMYFRAERALDKEAIARSQAEQAEKAAKEKSEELRHTLYVNSIQLADASYREGNISRMRELLESCPEDLRAWEWNRLRHIADQSRMTLRGHSDEVLRMAVSPDGKRLVSGSADETVKVWDAATGTELMTLRGHGRWINSVSFSPDGKRIVSGGDDKTIKVWDGATGTELMTLRGHEEGVLTAAFSPDGKRIVSSSYDKTVKVWDAATGGELMTLRGHESDVISAAFSPDGKWIVSGSQDNTIKVWDAATGTELMTLRGHERAVSSVAFSPDGMHIISSSEDKTIKVWDTAIRGDVVTLSGHWPPVFSIVFSPDGKRLVSGSWDETIKIWDAPTGAEIMTLCGHEGWVWAVSFSADGKRIVSGSKDKTIKVWDAADGEEVMTLCGHEKPVLSVAFGPDGKRIVSGGGDGTVKVWDAANGAELMTLRGHDDWVVGASFSPDGKRIVSGSYDNTIKIWDAANGAELITFRGHEGGVRSVDFSPDGKRIVSGSDDGTVKVWDAVTGGELMTLRGHSAIVYAVAFSPNGKRIVSNSMDRTVKVWDAATGTELMTLRMVDCPYSIAFSPDGKTIAAGCLDNGIKLWESTTPAGGYELRWNAEAARKLVDDLYEEHGFYEKVIDKLNTDETLAESVREVALQIANSRKWEDVEKLKKDSWEVVSLPDGDAEAYKSALEKAQKANVLEPNNPSILTALGVAQYRVGVYEDAMETLKLAEKMRTDEHLESDPANLAFTAMALHKLDRTEEAKAALDRLRDLCKDEQFAEDKEVQAFLEEVERVLSGKER